MNDMKTEIQKLVIKAASAERADEAMKFAQAASNLASAWWTLQTPTPKE